VCESPVGVLTLAARGLDNAVKAHEVAKNDAHVLPFPSVGARCTALPIETGNAHETHRALNTLQFTLAILPQFFPTVV
jgi:hypothetical protein